MTQPDAAAFRFHEDTVLFREAVSFTSAKTGFPAPLVEKDYFCTVVLAYLASTATELVFKGGTCLAKVLVDFYRLSEDLYFTIPLPIVAPRSRRSKRAHAVKCAVDALDDALPGFKVLRPLCGANNSTQYLGAVGYESPTTGRLGTIRVEVSLREPLLTLVHRGAARTLLLHPITQTPMAPAVETPCISRTEAMAEKLHAALTRRDVAIRDFYDIDFALRALGVDLHNPELIDLLRRKLAVPGSGSVDVSPGRQEHLRRQLPTCQKPVLRTRDFDAFDPDRAFTTVAEVARRLA